uniref:DDE Tnp4 domain-containing protein n=1 Tax=Mycena chlorophos TaxID=658473 RepID=A0ABQ0L0D9_MYCCL|nr:predicted protein [Mycena chlorophos]
MPLRCYSVRVMSSTTRFEMNAVEPGLAPKRYLPECPSHVSEMGDVARREETLHSPPHTMTLPAYRFVGDCGYQSYSTFEESLRTRYGTEAVDASSSRAHSQRPTLGQVETFSGRYRQSRSGLVDCMWKWSVMAELCSSSSLQGLRVSRPRYRPSMFSGGDPPPSLGLRGAEVCRENMRQQITLFKTGLSSAYLSPRLCS